MIDSWLFELAKGIGKIFLNPLLYWSIILVFIVGYKRVKQERNQFGFKIFDIFSEWKNTWVISLVFGLIISILILGTGMVFSYEVILLLSIVVIILSLLFRFTMLSASYTIGITYFLLLLSPLLLEKQTLVDVTLFSQINFTSLVILLGILLIGEAIMLRRIKRNETFPELVRSDRGIWIGQHRLKKLSIIPFFVLVPSGMITPFAPFWPFFEIGGESYSLLLVPFIIGLDHVVRGSLPQNSAKKLSKSISLLGVLVLLLAITSIYLSWLSMVAVVIAILGREYINYNHRVTDKEEVAYFNQMADGIQVLGILPGTPSDRLGILVGEKIVKVNGKKINNVNEFYGLLQKSGAYFKLEVIDDANEMRFVQSALYEEDHHELGIIFTEKPYRDDSLDKIL